MGFTKGDRVKIRGTEFTGTITGIYPNGPTGDFVPSPDGIKCWPTISAIPLEWLELVQPRSWPPQVGDIWEADGMEWFARNHPGWDDKSGPVILISDDGHMAIRAENGFMDHKPVLVRRRDVKP